jgi:PTS system nitrogen regulatory IIA component
MHDEDFDIDSLAAFLHLTPQQVMRLADRGKVPGRKVGGEWRFSAAEIHHWLEERIGLSDDAELAQMETVLHRSGRPVDAPLSIADMLPLEAIAVPLPARTRGSVITAMTELAANTGLLWEPEKMAEAVRAREDMHPTALDNGIALLHPRRPMAGSLGEAFLAFGRTETGIPFGSSRGVMTDLFFLICSVNDRDHLRTLARLSRLISDDRLVEALRLAPDAAAVREAIIAKEEELGPVQ